MDVKHLDHHPPRTSQHLGIPPVTLSPLTLIVVFTGRAFNNFVYIGGPMVLPCTRLYIMSPVCRINGRNAVPGVTSRQAGSTLEPKDCFSTDQAGFREHQYPALRKHVIV